MRLNWNLWSLFIVSALLIACHDDPLKDADVSNINISYRSDRLDKDILAANFADPVGTSQTLYHKYGSFYCDYFEVILQIGPCLLDSGFLMMQDFVNNEFVAQEFQAIQKVHDSAASDDHGIPHYDHELSEALKHWKYYFPDSLVPGVVYFNSAFNASIYSTDSVIGIALDFYLGRDHEIISLLEPELFPQYVKENMDPMYLPSDAVKDWLFRKTNVYAPLGGDANLLDQVVYTGKVMYLLDAVMPATPDSLKMNWTSSEYNWVKDNEANVWKEMARQEILFGKGAFENQKWLINGPFTNAGSIPQESPPQLGIYMGWQFVRSYMKEFPETSMMELLTEKNSQKILNSYRP